MELSMKDTFPVCVDILQSELRPMHYRELTETMLRRMNVQKSQVDFHKEIENVREKLLRAGQRGTFYTGSPLCMGGLRHWFKLDQLSFNTDWIAIPGSAKAGCAGAFEVLMRSRYMIIHNPNLANTELLNQQRASGLVLEKHVADWIKELYPSMYRDPDNHCQWNKPCSHDFKLILNQELCVDVAGPDWRGNYGKRGKKQSADVHLLCRVSEKNVLFEGVVSGSRFTESVIPVTASSPTAFIVYLNCWKYGIDYHAVVSSINESSKSKAA